jgi:hypothetical protein
LQSQPNVKSQILISKKNKKTIDGYLEVKAKTCLKRKR